MDTYQCPDCGGTVTRDDGCRGCGRPYDRDVAALAMFKRTVAALEAKKRQYEKDQLQLKAQLAHASAQRDSLARLVREKFDREAGGRGSTRSLRGRFGRRGDRAPTATQPPPAPTSYGAGYPPEPGPTASAAATTEAPTVEAPTVDSPQRTPVPPDRPSSPWTPPPPRTPPSARTPPPPRTPPSARTAAPVAAPGGAAPGASPPGGAPPSRPRAPAGGRPPRHPGDLPPAIAARLPGVLAQAQPQARVRAPKRPRPPADGPGRLGGAETSTATSQSAVLVVGGLLLAGAAVVLAVFGSGSLGAPSRVALLTLATAILLMLPVQLARRGLVATAETLASVGLLMVLLDGYVAWSLGLLGASLLPTPVYFGFVCLATALIATAYRGASHLIAPRYATVGVLQPVPPLFGYEWIHSPTGWGLVLAGVAALDLALGISLTRPGRFAALAGFVTPVHLRLRPRDAPEPEPEREPVDPTAPPVRPESAPEEPDDVKTPADFADRPERPARAHPRPARPRPAPTAAESAEAPAILRDLTWVLFTLAYGASLAYACAALISAGSFAPTVRAALVLLLAAGIGLAGALAWRRNPLPDLTGALATLAIIGAVTRVGMVALPGRGLLFASIAVAAAAVIVPLLPGRARYGPRLANGAAAAVTALVLAAKAAPAIAAPLQAAHPWWQADLSRYAERTSAAAGSSGWQLVLAGALLTLAVALALRGSIRTNAALAGGVLTLLTLPAAGHLGWEATPGALALAAIAFGASGLAARDEDSANGFVASAAVLGGYATLTSLTHPAVTSLTLAVITLGGFTIATLRPPRTDPRAELAGQRVGDWAAGGAAFALPGAVCAGFDALVRESVVPGAGASFVLAGGFVAVSATLGYAAIRMLAGRPNSRPLLLGTSLGAFVVASASLAAHGTTIVDMAVSVLLAASSLLLWKAPSLGHRVVFGQDLDGQDLAAAAVTASATAALARVLALAVPGIGLVTTAVLVFAVAVVVRAMPARQRRGPIAGELLIGAVIMAASGVAAVGAGAGVIDAATPVWHADLGPAWWHTAAEYSLYGWQPPAALLLIALATVIVVPSPRREGTSTMRPRDGVVAVAVALAGVAAPVAFGWAWWSPVVIGLLTTIALGVSGCLGDLPRVAYIRAAVAAAVATYTVGASLTRPASTAATLVSLTFVGVLVAALAGVLLTEARTASARVRRAHLVPVGGGASGAAVLSLTGAAAAVTAGAYRPAPVVLVSALAALSLALTVAGLTCWRTPGFLPYVTAAVGVASSVIALAALPHHLPVGVYGATGALLGVLAELLRVGAVRRIGWRPEDGWQPVEDWSPGRGWQLDRWIPGRGWFAIRRWRPASQEAGFGARAAAASAVPAAIAVAAVALPLVTALFGPYHFALHPWRSTLSGSADLSPFNGWKAHGTDVIAVAVLTFAGALAAIGLGGSRGTMANRTVAVVVPGVGLTMLLMPAGTGHGSLQAAFALLVTTLCGLSLALTVPPAPDSVEDGRLRLARRLVFALAVLATFAGQLGSLATRSMTIQALAGSVVVGAIAAIWGRYPLARILGWYVAVGAAQLLAVAASLASGYPPRWAASPLLGVCAVAIAIAATLPRWHPTVSTEIEIMIIEASAYLGMGGALILTAGALRYTALACTALGAILGLAASRPGRPEKYRQLLIFSAAAAEVIGVWLLMSTGRVALPEAYSLPFAVFALLVGVLELQRRPDLGSWLAYGPALIAGFLPSLALVLMTDTAPLRRVLVIVAGVLTLAVGSVRRQKAPVVVGSVVTASATLHELLRLSAMLPWWVLLMLFGAAGALLIGLGATYEKRRRNVSRLRGALNRLR